MMRPFQRQLVPSELLVRCYFIWKTAPQHLHDSTHLCPSPAWALVLLAGRATRQDKLRDLSNSLWHHCDWSRQNTTAILFLLSPFPDPILQFISIFRNSFVSVVTEVKPEFTWRSLCWQTTSNWTKTHWREMPTGKRFFVLVSYTRNILSANAKFMKVK